MRFEAHLGAVLTRGRAVDRRRRSPRQGCIRGHAAASPWPPASTDPTSLRRRKERTLAGLLRHRWRLAVNNAVAGSPRRARGRSPRAVRAGGARSRRDGVAAADLSTDQRIVTLGAKDPHLVELLFQYGRYLLIACSRPGTQPANLQGLWNEEVRAPWSSNFTININTQMNYWPAETTGLAELHEPLITMVEGLAVNGRKTAADQLRGGRVGGASQHRRVAPHGDGRRLGHAAIRCGRSGRWPARGSRSTCTSTSCSAAICATCAIARIR